MFVSTETVLLLAGGNVEGALRTDLSQRRVNHAIGVRLDDPAATASFTSHVEAQTGASGLTWITVANDIGRQTEGAVLFFSIFTVFAIAVAAFVIANAVAASVLSRTKEIGVLKAVGLTPRQVTTVFLVQNLALAVVAATIGASAGQLAAPLFVEEVADLLNTSAPLAFEPGLMLTVVALITAFVLLVTWLPAWRARRMSAVSAISGGARLRPKRSRLAALASRMRAPQVVAYGIKDAFTRPARTWLNVATVAVAAAAVMFTLTFDATISNAAGSPVQYGYAPSEVKIIPLPAFGSLRASGTVGGLAVPGHQVVDSRLIGGRPPRAVCRRFWL